jgi:O-antigen ligase
MAQSRCCTIILFVFLVGSPVVFWHGLLEPFELCKSSLTQVVALALLAVGVAAARGRSWSWRWASVRELFAGPAGLAVLAGCLSAIFSTIFSMSPRTSIQGAADSHAGLVMVLALAILFGATRAVCRDADTATRLLAGTTIGLGVACAYALLQTAGMDPFCWEGASVVGSWVRPGGTLGHPNYLAGFAVMALPLAGWQIACACKERRWSLAVPAGLVVLAGGIVVVVALSRAAWLAGVVAGLILVGGWLLARRSCNLRGGFLLLLAATLLKAGLACVLMFTPFAGSLVQRLSGLSNSPGRLAIWRSAWDIFRARPWTGCGLDTFGLAFTGVRTPEYWAAEWGILPVRAHNDFLQALATQGLPGGVAYLLLPAALGLACVQAWRRRPGDRGLIAAFAAAMAAFYVQNLFGFAVASTTGLLAVIAGVVSRLAEPETIAAPTRERVMAGTRRAWVRAALLPGMGCLVVSAWWIGCPLVASALSQRGDDWLSTDPARAVRCHGKATALAPWNDLLRVRHAKALLVEAGSLCDPIRQQQSLRKAGDAIAVACRLVPCSASNHANRGRVLTELARAGLGTHEAVLAAFDRALVLDPCDTTALADAARAATTAGCFDRADDYLGRGVALDANLGMLHAEKGALALARSIRVSGPDACRLLTEAETHFLATTRLEWHGETERPERAMLLLGLTWLQQGRANAALVMSKQLIERHPDWPAAWRLNRVALDRIAQTRGR